jgi:hypothetical protein
MNYFNKINQKNVIIKIIIIFPFLQIFFFSNLIDIDLWDGNIISAMLHDKKNVLNLKKYVFSYGHYFSYYLSLFFDKIASILKTNYFKVTILFYFFTSFFIIYEVKKILHLINIDKKNIYICLIFFSTFPIWHIFLSSVLFFYWINLTLGLLSIRLIHNENNNNTSSSNKIILGFIILNISYSLHSMLVLLPVLSYLYDFKKYDQIFPQKKTIIIFGNSFIYYFIIKYFFPLKDYNIDYNNPLVTFNLQNLLNFFFYFVNYLTFFTPHIIFILITFFFLKKSKVEKIDHRKIMILLFMFLASILPYILVAKDTYITEVARYTQRHALLMALPYTLISSSIFNFYMKAKIFKKSMAFFFLIFVCMTNFIFFEIGIFKKINDYLFLKSLTNLFISNKEIFLKKNQLNDNYAINLFDSESNMQFEEYELMYSYFLAFKKFGTIVHLTNQKQEFKKKSEFYLSYNYIFELDKKINCNLYVNINSERFIGFLNISRNVLSLNTPPPLTKVNYYESECLN